MLALISVIVGAFGVLASLSAGIRPQRLTGFLVVAREPVVPSYGPIVLALGGYLPGTGKADMDAGTRSPAVRVILVSAHAIELFAGGRAVREIRLAAPVATLAGLATIVDDPAWIARTAPGQITLRAALAVGHGVGLLIGGPGTRVVRLVAAASAFIGADGGRLDFTGVTVEGVPSRPVSSSQAAGYYRPFVMATGDAVLDITNATFEGLGWNWLSSYGTAWEGGSTGRAVGSTFENCFIGAYTGYSHNILFRDDIFRDNVVYGLDPHSYSRGLMIDHVLAEDNRAHGIIFSNHVTDSSIEDSTSRDNGENGIMMDDSSTGNRIIGDTVVDNKGDGLVTSLSPGNVFADNTVIGNRIGVRLSAADAPGTTLTGNRIDGNVLAVQPAGLGGGNSTAGNGDQWNAPVIARIWLGVAAIIGLTALLLAVPVLITARSGRSAAGDRM